MRSLRGMLVSFFLFPFFLLVLLVALTRDADFIETIMSLGSGFVGLRGYKCEKKGESCHSQSGSWRWALSSCLKIERGFLVSVLLGLVNACSRGFGYFDVPLSFILMSKYFCLFL